MHRHECWGTVKAPAKGSYQQETVFGDFRNGCRPAGPTRQHADFTLMLERR